MPRRPLRLVLSSWIPLQFYNNNLVPVNRILPYTVPTTPAYYYITRRYAKDHFGILLQYVIAPAAHMCPSISDLLHQESSLRPTHTVVLDICVCRRSSALTLIRLPLFIARRLLDLSLARRSISGFGFGLSCGHGPDISPGEPFLTHLAVRPPHGIDILEYLHFNMSVHVWSAFLELTIGLASCLSLEECLASLRLRLLL